MPELRGREVLRKTNSRRRMPLVQNIHLGWTADLLEYNRLRRLFPHATSKPRQKGKGCKSVLSLRLSAVQNLNGLAKQRLVQLVLGMSTDRFQLRRINVLMWLDGLPVHS